MRLMENKAVLAQSAADRYLRSDAVVSREFDGETLVIPVRGKVGDLASIYSFNATGTTMWTVLDQARSLQELVCILEQEYDVSGPAAQADVQRFLGEACELGLVKVLRGDASEGMPTSDSVAGEQTTANADGGEREL